MSRLYLLLSAVSQVLRYVKNNNINKMPIDHNITPGWNSKPRFIIKVFRFPRKTLLFTYVFSSYFFRKICPGNFSETIRQISKISPRMIGIYLQFVPFLKFLKLHFRLRVRVHFLTFQDLFCARKFFVTVKDIHLKISGLIEKGLNYIILPFSLSWGSPGSENSRQNF